MHYLAPGSFFKFTQRIADTLEVMAIFFSMFIAETANIRDYLVFNHISFATKQKLFLTPHLFFSFLPLPARL